MRVILKHAGDIITVRGWIGGNPIVYVAVNDVIGTFLTHEETEELIKTLQECME